MPIVFGNVDASDLTGGSSRANVARAIVDSWGAFIRTSNPTPSSNYLSARGPTYASTASLLSSAGVWPRLTSASSPMRQLGPTSFDNAAFSASAICDVLDGVGYPFQQINSTLV